MNNTTSKVSREFKAFEDVRGKEPIVLENVKFCKDQNFITICDEVNYIIYTVAIPGWADCYNWGARDCKDAIDMFNEYLKDCDQVGDFKLW